MPPEQYPNTLGAVHFFEAMGKHLNRVCFKGGDCFSFSSSLVKHGFIGTKKSPALVISDYYKLTVSPAFPMLSWML